MHRYTAVICGLLVAAASHGAGARGQDAGLKLRMLQGHPVVDGVFVNGRGPYRFLVDTGSTLNHLDPKLARSIGLTPSFRTEVVSATGTTVAPGCDGAQIVLGEVRASGQPFLLDGLDAVHELSPDIQGVLGQAFLSNFDYQFDLRSGRLAFDPTGPTGARAPLRTTQGRPAISTSLGWLILDSGAQGLILFGMATANNSFRLSTVSGSSLVSTVPRQLLINGRTFWSGDAIGLPRPVEDGVAGLLPISLFRTVYVCNSKGYVILD